MEQEIGKERYTPMGQEAESEIYQVDMEKIRRQLDAEDKVIEYLAGEIAKERKKPAFLQNQARIDKCIDTIAKLKNHKTEYSQEELAAKANALLAKARAKEAAETAAAPARRYRLRPVLVAVIVLVAVCLCGATACGVIPSLKNWFLKLIDMPAGTSIDDNKVSYTYNGKLTQYDSIEELYEKENLFILYPNSLSDNMRIIDIKRVNKGDKDKYFFEFSSSQLTMIVTTNYYSEIEVSDVYQTYVTDEIVSYYWEDEGLNCYMAIFVYNNCYYSISADNSELLFSILKNLKVTQS